MPIERADPSWLVLTDEDSLGLQQYGVLDLNYESGYQELHKGCFFRHDDISNALRELPPKSTDMLKIPLILVSRRVLIWLGFSDKMADQLWQQWLNMHGNRTPGVLEFRDTVLTHFCLPDVAGTILTLDPFTDDDSEWRQILHAHGLSQQFVDMIMDPRFREQRLIESCVYWIEDTLRQRWDLDSASASSSDSASDEDEDKVPEFYTAKNLPCEGTVPESTFLTGLRESLVLPCACDVRKDSRRHQGQDHLILYKVVTSTQLKDIRLSSHGNPDPMVLSNIDSLVEIRREPEREPFLYNDTTGDDDTGNSAASVGSQRRARKRLVFSTSDRELALAEYKWAVHRLDKSVGTADGAKFAGGADVRMLEIRIPMEEIDDLLQAKLAHFTQHFTQQPYGSDKSFIMWREMAMFSRYKELLRPSSFARITAGWWKIKAPHILETRRTVEPTLCAIREGKWIVLGCPAVRRRFLWQKLTASIAAKKGTATSGKPKETATATATTTTTTPTPTPTTNKDLAKNASPSSPSLSSSSCAPNADHNYPSGDLKYCIFTGDYSLGPVDEHIFNVTEDWMRDWLFKRICYFEAHKVVLDE
ncbi:hypothetical protein QBC45DRAFT_373786 [Copromyces sp. CBS 386.78]|nr:hypothetical protein QBC45DRAFT_373786 [Copromyces sp. CBS 386.78]